MFKFLTTITLTVCFALLGCDTKPTGPTPTEIAQGVQIQELTKRVAALEQKPVEHHYELRNEGSRTFRFDPATGDSCISLASKADWKMPDTIRQGCQYQDFMNDPLHRGDDMVKRTDVAEYLFVGKHIPTK